jgi:hypothetical protein
LTGAPHQVATIVVGAVALLSIVACNLVPGRPAIACGDVPAIECERQAAAIIADARRDTRDKRIVSISISRHDGIDVLFDDGTGWSMIP